VIETDEQGIALKLRAGGSEPVEIAQVQVDGAFWRFAQRPPGPIARGESVRCSSVPVGAASSSPWR